MGSLSFSNYNFEGLNLILSRKCLKYLSILGNSFDISYGHLELISGCCLLPKDREESHRSPHMETESPPVAIASWRINFRNGLLSLEDGVFNISF